ncbi:alcohol dehydrogenase catalytic domain-containing protein [Amycolatopsis keratiniphila]|uniref:Alcohol dehydrogenase zinc-binding domain-containing protein n=1 Tax=Amycolatopsis keratiniphila TaxID=129921 RepID=R4SWD6_9PSEU|nr:zinc-binding dehydrogenase [Amycolatopsis keratiniphila]AGM07674.1 alcohol dehydrogenase zinc-binding domain-containing protein [Amycolatopsis keratiniphila]
MTSMRALRQDSANGPEDLHLVTDAPVPAAGPGEILLKVTAAGVNFADVMQTRGTYEDGPEAPYIAGFEAAGEVVAVGEGVTVPAVGDRVVGTGGGAFAEYMVMPAAGAVAVPEGWSDEQAIGLILNWVTALAALKLGRLAAGETVLVQAAAGGVGQAAVRLAKHYGATVVGTASPGKHDVVRSLGADRVLGYGADPGTADLVLESVGGAAFATSLAAAKRVTGRVVVYGVAGGEVAITNRDLNFRRQIHVIGLHLGVLIEHAPAIFAELMDELRALIAAGVCVPGTPTVYDLADGPKALAELEARATSGKLVLRP